MHQFVPMFIKADIVTMFAVRSNLYHLLGIFAAVYPEHMVKYSSKLLDVYVGLLKVEVMHTVHSYSQLSDSWTHFMLVL